MAESFGGPVTPMANAGVEYGLWIWLPGPTFNRQVSYNPTTLTSDWTDYGLGTWDPLDLILQPLDQNSGLKTAVTFTAPDAGCYAINADLLRVGTGGVNGDAVVAAGSTWFVGDILTAGTSLTVVDEPVMVGAGETIGVYWGWGDDGGVAGDALRVHFGIDYVGASCSTDGDGDGYADDVDNCPTVFNVVQGDQDLDGIGNLCDNCPSASNLDQADGDADGRGDVCEAPAASFCDCPCYTADDVDQAYDLYLSVSDTPARRRRKGDRVSFAVDLSDGVVPIVEVSFNAHSSTVPHQAFGSANGLNGEYGFTCVGGTDFHTGTQITEAQNEQCQRLLLDWGQAEGLLDATDLDQLGEFVPPECPDPAADADGDGVLGTDDACPDEDASACDTDDGGDGCLDDSDFDGLIDCDGTSDFYPDCDDFGTDTDEDDAPDCGDPWPYDPFNDADGDGIPAIDEAGPLDICPSDADDDHIDGNYTYDNDHDADGACNIDDQCEGFDDGIDLDGDGVVDGCDLCVDSNADGECTTEDSCYYAGHGGDADVDGTCDDTDICPTDYLNDNDNDTVCGNALGLDTCPGTNDLENADQDNLLGCLDACPNDFSNDVDGDGVCGDIDNCPGTTNRDQGDTDHDGIGNACEPDSDGDTVIDDLDNCPALANPNQTDTDGDRIGDVCDADDDNDGIRDGNDRCAATPLGTAVTTRGCSAAQTCPTTTNWKNHGAYVECVEDVANTLYRAGTITRSARQVLVTTAAQSNVGKHRSDRDRRHDNHGHDRDDRCQD